MGRKSSTNHESYCATSREGKEGNLQDQGWYDLEPVSELVLIRSDHARAEFDLSL